MQKRTHMLAMKDGVGLATDVYLPGEGKYPALLIFTPYGRVNKKIIAEALVPRGYALVVQDVRGRYDSEGDYDPINQEKSDGPATVDWVATQPWYDGTAGMGIVGISYLATVGLAVAAQRPEVKAMLNMGGFASTYDITHRGGALVLHHLLPWSIITSFSPQPSFKGLDMPAAYRTLPLEEAAATVGFDNRLWRRWATHRLKDHAWQRMSVDEYLDDVDIPILHISGWYDMCLGETLGLYRYFAKRSAEPQYLVVGPWTHNGVLMGPTALHDVDFGQASRPNVFGYVTAWFDRWLKGTDGAMPQGPLPSDDRPVSVFVTGKNRWDRLAAWPPVATTEMEFYLEGRELVTEKPGPENGGMMEFYYDPENPVPTVGGAIWEFPLAGLEPGPADQRGLHQREDILVFESGQLDESLSLMGPIKCQLYAATDGLTTDFTIKLLDIGCDDSARIVAQGVIRGHLRQSPAEVTPLDPGSIHRFDIDLWAAAHTIEAGHRLGLEVSSSCFPMWDRNLNSLDGAVRTARQQVYWGGEHGSRLILTTVASTDSER